MAKISIRVRINPGRIGAPLRKLSSLSQEIHSFLKGAVSDLAMQADDMDWIARDFTDGSVEFKAENAGDFGNQEAREFHGEVSGLVRYDPTKGPYRGRLRKATLHQYAVIGKSLDPDERLEVSIPNGGDIHWESLTKQRCADLEKTLARKAEYLGAVFGKINALYKEASTPYFNIRLSDGDLVNCYYSKEDYKSVYELLKNPDAFVHVGGVVSVDLVSKKTEQIKATKFRSVVDHDKESLKKLLSASDIYGDISTEDFVSWFRDEGH